MRSSERAADLKMKVQSEEVVLMMVLLVMEVRARDTL
jgi:hypothetical protein